MNIKSHHILKYTIALIVAVFGLLPIICQPWYGLTGDWVRDLLFIAFLLLALWKPEYALAAFLVILPTSVFLTRLLAYPYPKYAFVDFALLGILAGAYIKIALKEKYQLRFHTLDILVAAFWLVNTASMLTVLFAIPVPNLLFLWDLVANGLRDLGWRDQLNNMYPLHQWYLMTSAILMFYLIRYLYDDTGKRKIILRGALGTAITAVIIGVYNFIGYFPESKWFARGVFYAGKRFAGILGESNQDAGFIFTLSAAIFVLALFQETLRRRLFLSGIVILLVALLPFTGSKFILFGLFFLFIYVTLLYSKKYIPLAIESHFFSTVFPRILLVALIGIGMAVLLVTIISPVETTGTEIAAGGYIGYKDIATRLFDIEYFTATIEHRRMYIWVTTTQMMKEFPLSGIGYGRFISLKQKYASAIRRPYFYLPHENSHNVFLQMAAEVGIPAMVLFVLIGLAIIVAPFVVRKLDRQKAAVLLPLTVALMAMFFNFLTTDNYLTPEYCYLFWFCCAISIAILSRFEFSKAKLINALAALLVILFIILFAVGSIIEGPKPDHRGFTDNTGISFKEYSNKGYAFRWLDSASLWDQEVRAGANIFGFVARVNQDKEVSDTVRTYIGGNYYREEHFVNGTFFFDPLIVVPGKGADNFFTFGTQSGAYSSAIKEKRGIDPRFISAQFVTPLEFDETHFVKEVFPPLQEIFTPDNDQLLWTTESFLIGIDGTLDELNPRILLTHPDIKEHPVTLSIYAGNSFISEQTYNTKGWKQLIIKTDDMPDDSIVQLKVDRYYVPSEHTDSSDWRKLGMALDFGSMGDVLSEIGAYSIPVHPVAPEITNVLPVNSIGESVTFPVMMKDENGSETISRCIIDLKGDDENEKVIITVDLNEQTLSIFNPYIDSAVIVSELFNANALGNGLITISPQEQIIQNTRKSKVITFTLSFKNPRSTKFRIRAIVVDKDELKSHRREIGDIKIRN